MTLVDGSVVETAAYQHVTVYEPSEFIVGKGKLIQGKTGVENEFEGLLMLTEIDSMKWSLVGSRRELVCWMAQQKVIRFSEGEYFQITREDSLGLWCKGVRKAGKDVSEFYGRLPRENVKQVDVIQLSVARTILLDLAFVAGVFFLVGSLVPISFVSFGGPIGGPNQRYVSAGSR